MIPWTHIEIGQSRIDELRRAADHYRMEKALRAAAPHVPAYGRALAWVGPWLVTIGARLERRYSRIQPAATLNVSRVTHEVERCC